MMLLIITTLIKVIYFFGIIVCLVLGYKFTKEDYENPDVCNYIAIIIVSIGWPILVIASMLVCLVKRDKK